MLHYFTTILRIKLGNKRGEFALSTMLGVIATLVVASLVVIPGMKIMAKDMLGSLSTWWADTSSTLFTIPA